LTSDERSVLIKKIKNENMTEEKTLLPRLGIPMIYIDHWEYDGFDGSHEPYWECPDGCEESEDE
jgi:hypothetical protein